MAAGCGILAILAQRDHLAGFDQVPLVERVANALVAYVQYLGLTFWPHPLSPVYPRPQELLPWWQVAGAACLLAAITVGVFLVRRSRPYLLVGWLWYVVTLLPVSGLFQVGLQGIAERYTYVPHIGLFLMLAWGVREGWPRTRAGRVGLGAAAGVLLLACTVRTALQVGCWRDSYTLWQASLKGDETNYLVQFKMADTFVERKQFPDALQHYSEAIRWFPGFTRAYYQRGLVLLDLDRPGDAIGDFRAAVDRNPNYLEAHVMLANTLMKQGDLDQALHHLHQARSLNEDDATISFALGQVLTLQQQFPAALPHLEEAVRRQPDRLLYRCQLAHALNGAGRTEAAREQYQQATQQDPHWPDQFGQAAWDWATQPAPGSQQGPQSLLMAEQACQATGYRQADLVDILAAVHAARKQFAAARQYARQALELAKVQDPERVPAIQERLQLYLQEQPYRRSP
jgi:tetratricopeptide (TPR) repeat protein